MEIKVKKQVEEVCNIDLPYYSKGSLAMYKIISEELTLILYHEYAIGLQLVTSIPSSAIDSDHVKITEDEFTNNYFIVQGKLNAKLI